MAEGRGDTMSGWLDEAKRRLLDLRRGAGSWGYRARSASASEPTALSALALLATADGDSGPGRAAALASARWLASARRPDGSVRVFDRLDGPGWPSPLALLAWRAAGGFEAERRSALGWLLESRGTTIAREPGGPLGHDASIVGWPWVLGTHSWVEPTAMALLALRAEGQSGHPRAVDGARLLVDRAIPDSGWNLGNPIVFGRRLRALPGPTGLALLALAGAGATSSVVPPALGYLRDALASTLAPASLGWGLLGLRAWGAVPDGLTARLSESFEKACRGESKPCELALLLLAGGDGALDVLGIGGRTGTGVGHDH